MGVGIVPASGPRPIRPSYQVFRHLRHPSKSLQTARRLSRTKKVFELTKLSYHLQFAQDHSPEAFNGCLLMGGDHESRALVASRLATQSGTIDPQALSTVAREAPPQIVR